MAIRTALKVPFFSKIQLFRSGGYQGIWSGSAGSRFEYVFLTNFYFLEKNAPPAPKSQPPRNAAPSQTAPTASSQMAPSQTAAQVGRLESVSKNF